MSTQRGGLRQRVTPSDIYTALCDVDTAKERGEDGYLPDSKRSPGFRKAKALGYIQPSTFSQGGSWKPYITSWRVTEEGRAFLHAFELAEEEDMGRKLRAGMR
ncbi:MAG: hypothetical protein ACYDH4_10185 [Candidatus Cryosericum sp.]